MRILYAAGNREGSYEQLKRYLPLFRSTNHQFKIAGYKKSLKEINADYCLDALLNFTNTNDGIFFNGNFSYYCKEISKFNPDLIISDFDIYTSIFAIDKNITLWQVSPAILYYSIPIQIKRLIGVHKYNHKSIDGNRSKSEYIKNILNNSQKKLVISHLCDYGGRMELDRSYEWCRPEFHLNQDNRTWIESNGTMTSLSDAFYNEQYTSLKTSEVDIETITGIACNTYYELGQLETEPLSVKKVNITINEKTKFLMELLK